MDKIPHRSFTVRTPVDLYCEIAEMARAEGVSINHKVGQLIRLGMQEHTDINARIVELIEGKLLPDLKAATKDTQ